MEAACGDSAKAVTVWIALVGGLVTVGGDNTHMDLPVHGWLSCVFVSHHACWTVTILYISVC